MLPFYVLTLFIAFTSATSVLSPINPQNFPAGFPIPVQEIIPCQSQGETLGFRASRSAPSPYGIRNGITYTIQIDFKPTMVHNALTFIMTMMNGGKEVETVHDIIATPVAPGNTYTISQLATLNEHFDNDVLTVRYQVQGSVRGIIEACGVAKISLSSNDTLFPSSEARQGRDGECFRREGYWSRVLTDALLIPGGTEWNNLVAYIARGRVGGETISGKFLKGTNKCYFYQNSKEYDLPLGECEFLYAEDSLTWILRQYGETGPAAIIAGTTLKNEDYFVCRFPRSQGGSFWLGRLIAGADKCEAYSNSYYSNNVYEVLSDSRYS